MKRILYIIGILLLLAVAGGAIFIATFNLDRYRPLVVKKMEDLVGRPVHLERLSLGWHGGIALTLKKLNISGGEGKAAAIEIENIVVTVRLLPLLKREVEVASLLVLQPHLHVIRERSALQVEGAPPLSPSQGAPGPVTTPVPTAAAPRGEQPVSPTNVPWNVSLLEIKDGTIRFTDTTQAPPLDLTIRKLDVVLRGVSFTRPIDFQVRMAVASGEQNLTLKGRLHLPNQGQGALLEDFRLQADFSRFKISELETAIPAIQGIGLREGLAGNLVVEVERLPLDAHGFSQLAAHLRLEHGRVPLAIFKNPMEELSGEFVAQPGQMTLKNLSVRVASGTVTAEGSVTHVDSQPEGTLHMRAEKLSLEALKSGLNPNDPHLKGDLSGSFEGTFQGLSVEKIRQTLTGQGNLSLKEGVVVNLNILREIFSRLSLIPGLVETLESRLPASYREKFAARDTILQPVDLGVVLQGGAILFNTLRISTDTLEMTGSGRIGWDGSLSLQTQVQMDTPLSAALVAGVKELQYLTDAHGRVTLPVLVQGVVPRVVVLPDVSYVAAHLATNKTEELLGTLLQRVLEKKEK